jgi:hypothetical protein
MTSLDEERLRQIRENAAFAVEEFGALTDAAFGLDRGSVAWVEGFIERQRLRYGADGAPGGIVSVIGSYLGEAIIAKAGGEWIEDDAGGLGVRFATGDTAYPFVKVQKQFDQGLEGGESILSFYNVSVDYVAAGKLHDNSAGEGA